MQVRNVPILSNKSGVKNLPLDKSSWKISRIAFFKSLAFGFFGQSVRMNRQWEKRRELFSEGALQKADSSKKDFWHFAAMSFY